MPVSLPGVLPSREVSGKSCRGRQGRRRKREQGWQRLGQPHAGHMPALRGGFGHYRELAPGALMKLLHLKAGPGRQNCAAGRTSEMKFSHWGEGRGAGPREWPH